MELRWLSRKDIDDKLWNGCVHFALGAVPYAYTWYLDNICEDWMGLVADDYQKVMPIVPHKKWGFQGVMAPVFARQLGVFSDVPLSGETVSMFFDSIPPEYRFLEMPLNESNEVPENYLSEERKNYLLPLDKEYNTIKSGYADDLTRIILDGTTQGYLYQTQIKLETFVDFYVQHASKRIKGFQYKDKYSMLRIIYKALSYSIGSIVGVFEGNNMVAASFFILHPQRIINVFPVFIPGKKGIEALAYLLDKTIQAHSHQRKYLDFGMPSPLIADSMALSFGAETSAFSEISKNELPGYIRLIASWSSSGLR